MEREGLSDEMFSEHSDISSGHGRIETRTCQQLLIDKAWLDKKYQWEGLKSIIKVTSNVIEKATEKETNETRWYISSLGLNAKQDETKRASMAAKKKRQDLMMIIAHPC